jgi:predicted phosphodiesterase
MKRITFISDTHTKHLGLNLPGGDILIHSGDIMSSGYSTMEIYDFLMWFDKIDNYDFKIFIAGNHDRLFQNDPEKIKGIITGYKTVDYLEDDWMELEFEDETIKIWGAPWQPWFYNWAFNLPRNGPGLASKWEAIPEDTDILITHGPPMGMLDRVERDNENVGCELLLERINEIKPKINVFGHIHEGYGYTSNGNTHFINASVLDGRYRLTNKPVTVDWDKKTNSITFIND